MKKFSDIITHAALSMRMQEAEKKRMRDVLREYRSLHPIRPDASSISSPKHTRTLFFGILRAPLIPAFLGITLIVSGGGISYAAERALPGELLHLVKTHVNEEIRLAFSFTEESRVSWETKRMERRLREVHALALKGDLTPDIEEKIVLQLETQAEKVTAHIAAIEIRTPDVAVNFFDNFDAALRAHTEALAHLGAGDISIQAASRVSEVMRDVQEKTAIHTEALLLAYAPEAQSSFGTFSIVTEAAGTAQGISPINRDSENPPTALKVSSAITNDSPAPSIGAAKEESSPDSSRVHHASSTQTIEVDTQKLFIRIVERSRDHARREIGQLLKRISLVDDETRKKLEAIEIMFESGEEFIRNGDWHNAYQTFRGVLRQTTHIRVGMDIRYTTEQLGMREKESSEDVRGDKNDR